MTFASFAEVLHKIETTAGRNQMIEILAELLMQLSQEELDKALYLLQGRLEPQYVDVEFNASSKLVLKALQQMVANGDLDLPQMFRDSGDVGLLVQELKQTGKIVNQATNSGSMDLVQVYSDLYSIAKLQGQGSQEAKVSAIHNLFQGLDPLGARYAARIIVGDLRLGLSDKSILDALSWYVTKDKSLRKLLDKAYGARADLGYLAQLVVQAQDVQQLTNQLGQVEVVPGAPVAAKLVEREKDSAAVFARMGECIAQPKLDGLRAQIHYSKRANPPVAAVYSRNMESLTGMFPDILDAVANLGVDSIILDAEAIGYDFESQTYLPFQETIQRRRKHDVQQIAQSIPIKAMCFDVLYFNGEDITSKPLQDRLEILNSILGTNSSSSTLEMLDSPILSTEQELEDYFVDKISAGLEGIIVKKLDTPYQPGTRNFDWIKLKANTRSDMVDTVDTVVLGYYRGAGARARFGIGALLVGVVDPDSQQFYSVAKVGTGMKDQDWVKIKQDLDKIITSSKPHNVHVEKPLYPDVWVTPQIVMEVDADEVTRSPSHTACRGQTASFEKDTAGRGLSLRFPRMKVWDRDKSALQATTQQELLRMFELRRGS